MVNADVRPSVLAITSELPWPLDSGGRLRTFHIQQALARECDVRLVVPVRDDQAAHAEALRDQGIHVVPVPVPSRTKSSEARRLLRSRRAGEPYIMYGRHDRVEVRNAFDRELAKSPDVVWLDHIDSLLFKPAAGKCVVDLHNIYSLILQRMAAETSNPLKRWFLRGEARRLAVIEQRAADCDAVLAVSSTEAKHFTEFGAKTEVVPNGVDLVPLADLPAGRMDAKPVVLYLGTLSWGPNVSAALCLAREIFPRVRVTLPEAELWLVGKDPCAEVQGLAGQGVTVTGSVPSVTPYLRDAALLAVPLDAGGGTRLKILEAFAAGLPVVSTAVGAEGIDSADGEHLVIAERGAMANAIVRLLCDSSTGARMAEQARELVREKYHWPQIGEKCVAVVRELL